MAILVFLDGVLRNDKSAPIPNGMALYKSLKEQHRVLVLCEDVDKDDHWLRQQRINNFDDLIDYKKVPSIGDNPKLRQVEWVRSQGPVEYVITSDPELVTQLLEIGMTTLVFLQPLYIREEFRPDSRKGVKAWSEIVEEIEKQQDAFKEDPRL